VSAAAPLLELRDEADAKLAPLLHKSCDFIDAGLREGGGVLVHCRAGKSRSATVVICYAMLRCGWELEAAWEAVSRGRHGLKALNVGFLTLLRHLHEKKRGTLGQRSTRSTGVKLDLPAACQQNQSDAQT
jgi:protein-tyrosine phosphatase